MFTHFSYICRLCFRAKLELSNQTHLVLLLSEWRTSNKLLNKKNPQNPQSLQNLLNPHRKLHPHLLLLRHNKIRRMTTKINRLRKYHEEGNFWKLLQEQYRRHIFGEISMCSCTCPGIVVDANMHPKSKNIDHPTNSKHWFLLRKMLSGFRAIRTRKQAFS